ncbi:MAG: endolytic transglycosylase MltG [Candidatus Buchananbacteria bacterium]|nr:endolytic transglycosylase MltG [Candidatus Buchananbacteria bacterium]
MKRIIIIIIAIIAIASAYFAISISLPAKGEKAPVYFKIESGETLSMVSQNLADQGLIRSRFIFEIYAKLRGWQGKLVAGDHLLNKNMNIREVLRSIVSSKNLVNEKVITIIEGWRTSEIADYLEKNNVVSQEDFLNEIAVGNWPEQYDFLKNVPAKNLEGFLFPDTYRVFIDATAHDIVKKMLDNFNSKLTAKMRSDIISQGKNIFEVVILASIIEREVPKDADKKLIADIFLKRIEAGIALQSDATVNYVTGKGRAQPSYDDLKIDSPYNTYKYRGLPPGPISNPGIKSLEAVIYPTKNPYYYFLTTLDDGTVIYSQTYEEHLINKAKYLN